MGLEWIVVRRELPDDVTQPAEPSYMLLPQGAAVDPVSSPAASRLTSLSPATLAEPNVEVRWGHAPGRETVGEASAAEKSARLLEIVRQHGRLDQLPPATVIDLRPAAGATVVEGSGAGVPSH
jgi:hypothetical protein